ncbi:hypothetical protein D3C71_1603020 [compost metagenome]
MWHWALVQHRHGRLFAAAHAGHGLHLHIALPGRAQPLGQRGQQLARTRQAAAQAVAHAQHQARGLGILAAHGVEVVVEARHLVHLGHGQVHLLGESHQVPVVQHAEVVVQAVQIFNEQVAPEAFGRARAQQLRHIGHRCVLGLAALEAAFAANALAHVVDRHGGNSRGFGGKVHGAGALFCMKAPA